MKKLIKSQENSFNDYGLLPPQATEVEQSVLGAIITYNDTSFLGIVKPEIFYKSCNALICSAIHDLAKERIPIDHLTIVNQLQKNGTLEEIGGVYYISQLMSASNPTNLHFHILILLEKYYRRLIIQWGSELSKAAFDDSNDVFDLIKSYKESLSKSIPDQNISARKTMKEVANKTLADIMLYDEGKIKTFYKSGHPRFDNTMMFGNGITLIAGAGGIGKSTFVTWWMKSLLQNNKDMSVYWVTIDHETGKSVNSKFLSSMVRLSNNKLMSKGYKLSQDHLEDIVAAQNEIQHWDIEFLETPCSIIDIEFKFKFFIGSRPKENLKVLIIDNVMRLTDNMFIRNKTEVDDYIANNIANIYKSNIADGHNINVVFLHHMTKEQLSSSNLSDAYRPTPDQIKGSSRYYDISETVLLLNRPGNYPKILADYPGKEQYLRKLFIAELAKNTFGSTDTLYFLCNMEYGIFKPF